jgi:Carboxypeptidase regulatory-like domain
MRRRFATAILMLAMAALVAPSIIGNVYGFTGCQDVGNQCYLRAQTTVPGSDATIHVTVDGNPTLIALPNTFSFGNGTTHTITVVDTNLKGISGARYVFHQWSQCGNQWTSGTSPTMTTPLMVANYTGSCPFLGPFVAQFDTYPPVGCVTNCLLDANTNVATSEGTVWVRINTTSTSNFYKLPLAPTLSYPNGTTITIQIMNLTFSGSSGAHYIWNRWTRAANVYSSTVITVQMIANYTTSGAGPFTAQFRKQYQLSIAFTDSSNQPVNPPASLTLSSSTSTVTLTSYSNIWLDATMWTTTDALWEGVTAAVGPQTIDLSGTPIATATIQLKAYPETIHVIDRGNNPVAGAQVTVIFSNSTSRQFNTDSQGNVQLGRLPAGSYTTSITYQGQSMGRWTADASQISTNTIQLSIGSSTGTTQQVSAIVLLTVFGLGIFLVLLAIRVRKPPPPPTIGATSPSSTGQ